MCKCLQVSSSEAVSFTTLSCEPDTPSPPKKANGTKNSLSLQWKVDLSLNTHMHTHTHTHIHTTHTHTHTHTHTPMSIHTTHTHTQIHTHTHHTTLTDCLYISVCPSEPKTSSC